VWSVNQGQFRLVVVLDQAPPELVRLVGYCESITAGIALDLITVTAYAVNGVQILVPQRIARDQEASEKVDAPTAPPARKGWSSSGAAGFAASIAQAPSQHQAGVRQLYEWAVLLERDGLVRHHTYHRVGGSLTLLPWLMRKDRGLVTLWNDHGPYISFWRTVFEQRAPSSIGQIERIMHPTKIGQGNTIRDISSELLVHLPPHIASRLASPHDKASPAFDCQVRGDR
jgi:hypothetical protein